MDIDPKDRIAVGLKARIADAVSARLSRLLDDDEILRLSNDVKIPLSIKDDRIHFIQDLDPDSREDRARHRCIDCDGDLTPHLGNVKARHFQHAIMTDCTGTAIMTDCTGTGGLESALHQMAKQIAAEMDGIGIEPISVVSHKYPDIREVAFAEGLLPYEDGVCEKGRQGYIPDVTARMKEFDPGGLLLIEILVTHAVGDEKRLRVEEDDLDMIEIDMSALFDRVRSGVEGAPLTKRMIREGLAGVRGEDQGRTWIHSKVHATLADRVRARVLRRDYVEARKDLISMGQSVQELRKKCEATMTDRGLNASKSLLKQGDSLLAWVESEKRDYLDTEKRLEAIIGRAPDILLDGQPVVNISDLKGDTTFQKAGKAFDLSQAIEQGVDRLGAAKSDMIERLRGALEDLKGMGPGDVDRLEDIMAHLDDLRGHRSEVSRHHADLISSVGQFQSLNADIGHTVHAAGSGLRLFYASTEKKMEWLVRDSLRSSGTKKEGAERPEKRYSACHYWRDLSLNENLFLGSSWAKVEPDSILGEGADAPTINDTLRLLCAEIDKLPYLVGDIHDVLQKRLDFFGGRPLHEALRYVNSRTIFPRLLEEIRLDRITAESASPVSADETPPLVP